DIYTCWELVGQDEFLVGSYKNGIQFDREAIDKWQGKNISKVDACSKCKYAFFCGGGCMAGALREGRGYNSPHCDGYPRVFQDLVPRTYFKFLKEQEEAAAGKQTEEAAVADQII
ncbi:MAG: SPASM domain-containing protein, partial [Dinghuibacter sp.]|nr:SPASM domain-containing protein [Dinghuibacter sp.]